MNTLSSRRVLLTGIGAVSPLGRDRETSWRQLVEGQRATRRLALAPQWDSQTAWIGAPYPDDLVFSPAIDPVISLALIAAREAILDAGIDFSQLDRTRVGCTVSSSKGGILSVVDLCRPNGAPVEADRLWRQFQPESISTAVVQAFGLQGPAITQIAACATGLASVVRGVEWIRAGLCDVVIAGSSDASLTPAVLASFRRMRVLAGNEEDPASACKPFDRRRRGFVVGEGSGIVVLESAAHAASRGRRGYAEWLGSGMTADASGMTDVDPGADSLHRAIQLALAESHLSPRQIDYINLHGTGTIANDLCETRAIRQVFGPSADQVATSSLKGAVGHLLGAASSVELVMTLLAMRDGTVPPTANLEVPDPACDLDYTPQTAQRRPIRHAMKLSLGFGGHVFVGVLGPPPEFPASEPTAAT